MKKRVKEVIIVEGRYDKNTLSQVIDAIIIETSGFGIFNDIHKMKLIKKLSESRGLIVMTDSDAAGFLIRNRIKSCIDPSLIKHAYVPDIYGKERRKAVRSKEGKLGVEGMSPDILLEALERAGASIDSIDERVPKRIISKADMFAFGLSGKEGSAMLRHKLIKKLNLPERLSADGLLDVLNAIMSYEDFCKLMNESLDIISDSL